MLHYVPNAGHGDGAPGMMPTLIAFFRSALLEKPFPKLQWNRDSDGSLHVNWQGEEATAQLWQAQSPDRDFRKSRWTAKPLDGKEGCVVKVDPPATGWTAYFVQVTFAGASPMLLSTQMTVVPKTFPHPDAAAKFEK
jgi:PhoPQ-activated pathogenicity-related protein